MRFLNLPNEWARLREKWAKPLFVAKAGGRTLDVCDLQVGVHGDVYLVYAIADQAVDVESPTLVPNELEDANGSRYVRFPMDMFAGGNDEGSEASRAVSRTGRTVRVAYWIPLVPPLEPVSTPSLTFSFVQRRPNWVGNPDPEPAPTGPVVKWAAKPPKVFTAVVPHIMVVLGLVWPYCVPEQNAASTRAAYYQNTLHDYEKALHWYWRANELSKQVHPLAHPVFRIKQILECLEALGRKQEADEVRKRWGFR